MPGKPEPFFQFREQLSKMMQEVKHIGKPVCLAAALLLLSAGLTYTVVTGISEQMKPLPPLAKNAQPFPSEKTASPPTSVSSAPEQQQIAQQVAATPVASKVEAIFEQPRRLPEGTITAAFGWQQHPVFQDWRFHTGIDIALAAGQPVQVIGGGRVSEVTKDRQLGLMVIVENGDYTFYYASLGTVSVKVGTVLENGAAIGTAGQSSTEPYDHLHLAVKKQGNYIDPQSFMK